MSYYIKMEIKNIVILSDKVEGALEAINELHEPMNLLRNASSGTKREAGRAIRECRWYSWVNNPEDGGFDSIVKALKEWNYAIDESEEGDIHISQFTGKKRGDDKYLYEAIAPFVNDGGTIKHIGDDEYMRRYIFNDGRVLKEKGVVVWER